MVPKKYIIYNVNHHGSLLNIICLKSIINRKDKTILVLSENEGSDYSQKMLAERIFDKIITFRLSIGVRQNGDELKKVLNEYFDGLLKDNGVSLNDILEIYTQADVINPFGIYAAMRGKKITIIEDSANRLSDMNKYEQFFNDKIISKTYYDLQKNLGILCGETDKYDLILYEGTDETRYFGFSHKRESVDYNKCYELLTVAERDSILKSYGVDIEMYRNVDTILFMNSDGYTESALDVKVPVSNVYTTLADYCSLNDEQLIIKPHPNNYLVGKNNFPNDKFIKNYPIEVINLIKEVKIRRTISAYTTAVKKIERFVDDDVSLGVTFFRTFSHIHKIYVSLSIVNLIVDRTEYKVYQNITRDCNYINNLLKITLPDSHYKNVEYIDLNDYSKKSICIVFDASAISSKLKTDIGHIIISFIPTLNCHNTYKIKIALNDIDNDVNVKTDFLYIFTSDNSYTDILSELSMTKKLTRRGLILNVSTQKKSS